MKNLFFASIILLFACKSSNKAMQTLPKNVSLNGKLYTAFFQQRAAEYRALCLQAYNIAALRIDNYTASTNKPMAIITDIDETILDNSPYAVHQAYKGYEYTQATWYEWTNKAAADTMPGAASFLKYAASKNVIIIYITNREDRERASTLKNLQKFGLPNADEAHLFTKQNTSSKEQRRQTVMSTYEIILLMGDNLADVNVLFDKKTELERTKNVDELANLFGKKFIIFPNCNYGDWESSLYKYNYKLSQFQKDSVLQSVLKSY